MNKRYEKISVKPEWKQSAEDIWQSRFEALTEDKQSEEEKSTPRRHNVVMRYSLAAAAAVIIVFSAAAWLYTCNIATERGGGEVVSLPDGSEVKLSAATSISYQPLLWAVEPNVKMEGEALFSGHHARGFCVTTAMGKISVLGTSFDVKTFGGKLVVTCLSGKVRVEGGGSVAVLTANMQAVVDGTQLKSAKVDDTESVTGWTRGVFSFDNEALDDVVDDIERYYNVDVAAPSGIDTLRYTGRFTRDKSPQDVVDIVARPYGIKMKIMNGK